MLLPSDQLHQLGVDSPNALPLRLRGQIIAKRRL